jgi:predicted nuclease with TOPRIM domain
MRKLIERLRLFEASGPAIPSCQLFGEAADEIEQLRAGCDRLHGYIAEKDAEIERLKRMRDMWKATANSNRDEIERLRAALERIADGCDLSNEAQAIESVVLPTKY